MGESNNNNQAKNIPDELSVPYGWMVRPCERYKDEYKECTSFKGRFHQYFIFGENLDCGQWSVDFNNCMAFRARKDVDALQAVIDSEKKRKLNRLANHYGNDVWPHRSSPPKDWNKPLPQKMQDEYKNTYLDHKAREYEAERAKNANIV